MIKKASFLFTFATLVLAVFGSKFERSTNPICEPTKDGYYTLDPNDCQKYYICGSTGRAFPKTCSPGFFQRIDERSGRCTTLKEANCGTRQIPAVYEDALETGISPVELPSKVHLSTAEHDQSWRTQANCHGQRDGIYNIPNQCRKYLTCAEGVAHVQSCPANLVFDELANEPGQAGCLWLENAKRTDCSQYETIDAKEEHHDLEAIEGYTSVLPWMKEMDCSYLPDGKHPIPNHCGVYFNCLGGKNLGTQQCPVGTAFENRDGFEGDCFFGEEMSRTDCAEQRYCQEHGAGNHYTRDRACDRFMYCSTERGMATPTNCPPNTIFDLISDHQGLGCVNRDVTRRSEC